MLIGIEDYKYGVSGKTNFTQSKAKITITNGVETEVLRMVANSILFQEECVKNREDISYYTRLGFYNPPHVIV